MNECEVRALVREFAPIVRDYCEKQTAPLLARIAVLEACSPERGERGERGEKGDDGPPGDAADPEATKAMIEKVVAASLNPAVVKALMDGAQEAVAKQPPLATQAWVGEQLAALPQSKDGEPGKSVTLEDVRPVIEAEALRLASAIPAPKDGQSVTLDDVRPLVERCVQEEVKTLPSPKDGIGIKGAIIDRDGNLVLTLDNGSNMNAGRVAANEIDMQQVEATLKRAVDALPKPKDGVDGFGFDDLTIESDGERAFTFKFIQGEREKAFPFTVPLVLDRGVFKEGNDYVTGDGVSWAGSFWIAREATTAKPGDGSTAWRLAVKRGRDGRDLSPLRPSTPSTVKLR